MTDAQMVEFLRSNEWKAMLPEITVRYLLLIADRLEKVTTPLDKPPSEVKYLNDLRGKKFSPVGMLLSDIERERNILTAAHDWQERRAITAECQLEDLLRDNGCDMDKLALVRGINLTRVKNHIVVEAWMPDGSYRKVIEECVDGPISHCAHAGTINKAREELEV